MRNNLYITTVAMRNILIHNNGYYAKYIHTEQRLLCDLYSYRTTVTMRNIFIQNNGYYAKYIHTEQRLLCEIYSYI